MLAFKYIKLTKSQIYCMKYFCVFHPKRYRVLKIETKPEVGIFIFYYYKRQQVNYRIKAENFN